MQFPLPSMNEDPSEAKYEDLTTIQTLLEESLTNLTNSGKYNPVNEFISTGTLNNTKTFNSNISISLLLKEDYLSLLHFSQLIFAFSSVISNTTLDLIPDLPDNYMVTYLSTLERYVNFDDGSNYNPVNTIHNMEFYRHQSLKNLPKVDENIFKPINTEEKQKKNRSSKHVRKFMRMDSSNTCSNIVSGICTPNAYPSSRFESHNNSNDSIEYSDMTNESFVTADLVKSRQSSSRICLKKQRGSVRSNSGNQEGIYIIIIYTNTNNILIHI